MWFVELVGLLAYCVGLAAYDFGFYVGRYALRPVSNYLAAAYQTCRSCYDRWNEHAAGLDTILQERLTYVGRTVVVFVADLWTNRLRTRLPKGDE